MSDADHAGHPGARATLFLGWLGTLFLLVALAVTVYVKLLRGS